MKKSLAFAGATILGVVGVAAGAGPAQADVTTTPTSSNKCATIDDAQLGAATTGSSNFYMDCIPQYGLGKAEFTITSKSKTHKTRAFPTGFSLTDSATKITSSVDHTKLAAYTGDVAYGAFSDLEQITSGSKAPANPSQNQFYEGEAAFKVASVTHTSRKHLPKECTSLNQSYTGVYAVKYKKSTTTFSRKVGSKHWTYTITATPHTLYLGLNFATGAFNQSAPQCAASNGKSVYASSESANSESYTEITNDNATSDGPISVNPYLHTPAVFKDFGTIKTKVK